MGLFLRAFGVAFWVVLSVGFSFKMILLFRGPLSSSASATALFRRLPALGVNATRSRGKRKKRECLGFGQLFYTGYQFLPHLDSRNDACVNASLPLACAVAFLPNVKEREGDMKKFSFPMGGIGLLPLNSDCS